MEILGSVFHFTGQLNEMRGSSIGESCGYTVISRLRKAISSILFSFFAIQSPSLFIFINSLLWRIHLGHRDGGISNPPVPLFYLRPRLFSIVTLIVHLLFSFIPYFPFSCWEQSLATVSLDELPSFYAFGSTICPTTAAFGCVSKGRQYSRIRWQ